MVVRVRRQGRKGALAFGVVAVVAVGLGCASAAVAGARRPVATGPITLLGSTASARPSVAPALGPGGAIFDNFGTNHAYSCCVGWTVSEPGSVVGTSMAANAFTPTQAAVVTRIEIALSNVLGTNNATIELTSDSGGLPGTVLESEAVSGQPSFGTCCGFTTVFTASIPVLAGHRYWVGAIAGPNDANDTWDAWTWNSTGQTGPVAFDSGSGWVLDSSSATEGAFAVLGCAATAFSRGCTDS